MALQAGFTLGGNSAATISRPPVLPSTSRAIPPSALNSLESVR
jgi:hypothetical protein